MTDIRWNGYSLNDEWELVFDNGSDTSAPTTDLLLFNFSGLNIVTYDYNDPKLKESTDELKVAIQRYKSTTPAMSQSVSCFRPMIPVESESEDDDLLYICDSFCFA